MKAAQDLIPWKVIDLNLRPFPDLWSFNNSIHFDGVTWRCVLRCASYCMPEGRTVRSKTGATGQLTKNAMVILDPTSWRPIQIFKMHERDGLPRASTPHRGFEDMRIFRTDAGDLQGIAASLHLQREVRTGSAVDGVPQHQPPEQVLLSFDGEYNIVAAQPIRGSWKGPEKNWVPFDDCVEPRFLYSISKGTLVDEHGRLGADAAIVRPSSSLRQVANTSPIIQRPSVAAVQEEAPIEHDFSQPKPPKQPKVRSANAQVPRGRRMMLDAGSVRVVSRSSSPRRSNRNDESTRMMGTGRVGLPTYQGLRGGTQLIRVADGAWLGIGHEMKFVNGRKHYWHVFYLVDSSGKLTATSEPVKLAPNGIEFAAGMAIDGERVVVSFGVDDMECKIGETSLSAVMGTLRPIER